MTEKKKKAMRIAIAEDVLKQIRAEENPLRVAKGYYVRGDLPFRLPLDTKDDLADHVEVIQERCEVCQKGALLLSKARLYDEIPIQAVVGSYQGSHDGMTLINAKFEAVTENLSEVFSEVQLAMLEAAFEFNESWMNKIECGPIQYGAVVFGARHRDSRERCIAIMENLIANDGEFSPPPATYYEMMDASEGPGRSW